jgi:phage terminase large subunit-like protein
VGVAVKPNVHFLQDDYRALRVVNLVAKAQIHDMATAAPSSNSKSNTQAAQKLGRSAVTGQFVLIPATKGGKVTIAEARTAANTVHRSKK